MFWVPYVRRLLVFPLVPLSQTQKTDENVMKNTIKSVMFKLSRMVMSRIQMGFMVFTCFFSVLSASDSWFPWLLLAFPASWTPCILIRTVREGAETMQGPNTPMKACGQGRQGKKRVVIAGGGGAPYICIVAHRRAPPPPGYHWGAGAECTAHKHVYICATHNHMPHV